MSESIINEEDGGKEHEILNEGKVMKGPSDHQKRKTKPIRRAKMNKRLSKEITILYSNIQGFVGKKGSITEIIESVNCDMSSN